MDVEKLLELDLMHMPQKEMLRCFSYDTELSEQVYDSLMGLLLPEHHLPWVKTIFVPGQPCYEEYNKMQNAYQRLCDRLGVQDEDQDVEIIVDSLLSYAKIAALEMFQYGRKCQSRLDTK